MDLSQYGITLETIGKWIFIGITCTFFLEDFQKRISTNNISLKGAITIAITLSFILLLLLLLGYIVTIVIILSIGIGMLLYLSVVAIYKAIQQLIELEKAKIRKRYFL